MIQKPEIQYVGQFYVYGSEAPKVHTPKKPKAKTRLPLARLEKLERVYVDPVALVSIAVAVVMLATMVVGVLDLHQEWTEYTAMRDYLSQLKQENAQLTVNYRSGYDLEGIRAQATGLGLIAQEEAQHMQLTVTVPEPDPEPTWVDELIWFWEGLFA